MLKLYPGPRACFPRILLLALTMLVCWCHGYSQAGTITVAINNPGVRVNNTGTPQVVGDSTIAQVKITSTYQIDTVVASVPGRTIYLTYSSTLNGYLIYTGTLNLVGLPQDTTLLTVTAIDHLHETKTVSGQFIYDHPPTLIVDSPVNNVVAHPYLHFRSRCHSDSGHCTITVAIPTTPGSIPLGTYIDSCDVTYDMSPYLGLNEMLAINAVDSRGSTTIGQDLNFFVETSPYLTPIFSADDNIYDFSDGKVFVMNNTILSLPHIINIANDSVTAIPFTGYINSLNSGAPHLTSHGAIFQAESVSQENPNGYDNLFEWHDGALDSLGRQYGNYIAAGDYAIYSPQSSWYLRNLATQTDQYIGPSTNFYPQSVTTSGVALYETISFSDYKFFLFNSSTGTATQVFDNNSGAAVGRALTDGRNILYLQGISNQSLYFSNNNGAYTDLLVPAVSSPVTNLPGTGFQIANGYTAYMAPNSQNKTQAWLRDTLGNKTQLTFTLGTQLDLLNSKGELMLMALNASNGYNRYIYSPGTGLLPISTRLGKSYYQDSTWYVVIGNTVFRLNLDLIPNKSDSFSINDPRDSVYHFTTGSFTSHFEGSGTLMSIVFSKVPSHGSLKVNGALQIVNETISRASLQNLTYTPTAGFTGVDTLYWVGSNGYTSSTDTGMLLINVNPPTVAPPAQPVIAGLNAAYCNNAGAAVFTMSNFPDTTAHASVVTDTVDQTPLVLGSGARCSIPLSGLTPGVHTVKVTYTNAGGRSSVAQNFMVVAASTPVVGLTAVPMTIPNTVAAVIVTALNVSGGGSAPLYTFSFNRGFSPALGGPGVSNSVVIDTASLAIGVNTVYVRMLTSDTCYTSQTAIDSIVITRPASGGGGTVTPPAPPVITGLQATYCSNGGSASLMLSDLPDSGTTVGVTLDGTALTSGTGGSYTIPLAGLSVGDHTVKATYTNTAGSSSVTKTFTVVASLAPIVSVYTDEPIVPYAFTSVTVHAAATLGGGTTPLFTYSLNRNFSLVLNGPTTSNMVVLDTTELRVGSNTVFVRMLSSDSCVTSPTVVDSVVITRQASSSPSNDSSSTGAYPNPFRDRLIVTELVATHAYTISLLNGNGMEIAKMRVSGGMSQAQLIPGPLLTTGIYLLRVYDETQGKVIRLVRLLGVGNN